MDVIINNKEEEEQQIQQDDINNNNNHKKDDELINNNKKIDNHSSSSPPPPTTSLNESTSSLSSLSSSTSSTSKRNSPQQPFLKSTPSRLDELKKQLNESLLVQQQQQHQLSNSGSFSYHSPPIRKDRAQQQTSSSSSLSSSQQLYKSPPSSPSTPVLLSHSTGSIVENGGGTSSGLGTSSGSNSNISSNNSSNNSSRSGSGSVPKRNSQNLPSSPIIIQMSSNQQNMSKLNNNNNNNIQPSSWSSPSTFSSPSSSTLIPSPNNSSSPLMSPSSPSNKKSNRKSITVKLFKKNINKEKEKENDNNSSVPSSPISTPTPINGKKKSSSSSSLDSSSSTTPLSSSKKSMSMMGMGSSVSSPSTPITHVRDLNKSFNDQKPIPMPSLDLGKVASTPNGTNGNHSEDSGSSSGDQLTPESESRLEELAKLGQTTPRFIHESKSISPQTLISIIFYLSNNQQQQQQQQQFIEKEFKLSSCSTIEEVLSLIIPNLIYHKGLQSARHTSNDEWETDHTIGADYGDHQSFALFHGSSNATPLHKERTILELGLKDGQQLELRIVGLNIQFCKIHIPGFSEGVLPAQATLKLTQFTSIRSIIRKLYLKFHTSVDISQYGIFMTDSVSNQEILLDEEELFSTYNISTQSHLTFRNLSTQTDTDIINQKSLQLKILITTFSSRFNHLTLQFKPSWTISKAIKITGLRTGLLDSLNKCGFFLTHSDDDDDGFWMDEDLTLDHYHLKNLTLLEFKQRCRKYIVLIKPHDRKCIFKFDQFVTVETLFEMLVHNENIDNPKQYCLAFKDGGQVLENSRYLWSYDIDEIEFKELPNRLLVFDKDGTQNLFYVDFNDPLEDVCKRLSTNLGYIPHLVGGTPNQGRKRAFTLKRLGEAEIGLDIRKSLKQLGVQPNDRVVLDTHSTQQDIKSDEKNEKDQSSSSTSPPSSPPSSPSLNNNNNSTIVQQQNNQNSQNSEQSTLNTEQLDEKNTVNIWEELPDSPLNIVYSKQDINSFQSIEAGTLNKLIIRLTSETTHDLMFMKALLMTYSSYTSSTVLLSKLFERFRVPVDADIDEKEKTSIQLRVANVIKYWVEHHYEDFGFASTNMMVEFVDTHLIQAFPQLGNQIRGCILKRTCGIKTELSRTRSNGALTLPKNNQLTNETTNGNGNGHGSLPVQSIHLSSSSPLASSPVLSSSTNNNNNNNITNGGSSPPLQPVKSSPLTSSQSTSSSSLLSSSTQKPPLQPSSPRKAPDSRTKGFKNPRTIFDFDDEEIARQLTLYDFMLYSSIKPTEFLNQAWNKPAIAPRKSPNILKIVNRFNEIGHWVVKLILEPERVKTRAKRMERIIKIAEKLRELKNFNTLMSFLGGLNNSALLRLKFTRALVSKKYLDILEGLEKEMSCEGSYKFYRSLLHNTDPPCVPFVGVYLQDLVFISEGNPNIIGNNLINFSKYTLIYKVISEVQTYQWSDYNLTVVPIIQTFIRELNPPSATQLYQISLQREPKGISKSEIF